MMKTAKRTRARKQRLITRNFASREIAEMYIRELTDAGACAGWYRTNFNGYAVNTWDAAADKRAVDNVLAFIHHGNRL